MTVHMTLHKLLVRFICVHLVVLASSTIAIKLKCSNLDDLHYSNPSERCTTFYKCTAKGQSESTECSPGSMFDFNKQRCSRAPGTCYEPICVGRSNGVYADTTHGCRRFFTCYAGRVTSIDHCPLRQLHNGVKCVHEDLVSCESAERTSAIYPFTGDQRCVGSPDGKNALHGSCRQYLICSGGAVQSVLNCNDNLIFDADVRQCVRAPPVVYGSTTITQCDETRVAATVIDDFVCRHKPNGSTADPTSLDCSTYVVCQNGKLQAQKRCSPQAIFNGELCVPAPLYQCPSRAEPSSIDDSCRGRANGMYPGPQFGCASYIRCMSQRLVEINACPSGRYYDMESKACVFEPLPERRRCLEVGESDHCLGRSTGWYSDTNCENYYHCHSGGMKVEYRCSGGKHFNGFGCVPKHKYSCPSVENTLDSICHNRTNGYYKDTSGDGCRSYNLCSDGRRITYVCNEGYIFDSSTMRCARANEISPSLCKPGQSCRGRLDGYYTDLRSNCRDYYYCERGERITQLTCRDNKVFNGRKCVSAGSYSCPTLYSRRGTGGGNCMPRHCGHQCEKNGFFMDLNSGCREYYSCIDRKSSKLSCPEGKVFNGELCVSEISFACPTICSNHNEGQFNCLHGGYVDL